MSLATGGDQVFAYQGTHASPTLIAGISANGAWDATLTNCTLSSTMSILPASLNSSNYAIAIAPEVDNARLKTSIVLTGNAATDRAAIHNTSNWDVDDVNPFVLPPNLTTLAVKFTYVTIKKESSRYMLEWGVAEESQIETYTLEESTDGRVFSEVGQVIATGLFKYSFQLPHRQNIYFYRVKARETSGKLIYSNTIKHNITENETKDVIVISQPNKLTIRFDNLINGKYNVFFYTAEGKKVYATQIVHSGITGVYEINYSSHMPSGIYHLIMNKDSDFFKKTFYVHK